jgi:hypothetical protein
VKLFHVKLSVILALAGLPAAAQSVVLDPNSVGAVAPATLDFHTTVQVIVTAPSGYQDRLQSETSRRLEAIRGVSVLDSAAVRHQVYVVAVDVPTVGLSAISLVVCIPVGDGGAKWIEDQEVLTSATADVDTLAARIAAAVDIGSIEHEKSLFYQATHATPRPLQQ